MFFENSTKSGELDVATIIPFRRASTSRHITMVSTYPPRQCGLATFACDVVTETRSYEPRIHFSVLAMERGTKDVVSDAANEVIGVIDEHDPASYQRAAETINASRTDALWVQHEYGIFGGPDGEMILDFVDRVAAPLIVTFHTVLESPTTNQRRIIDHLVQRASRIMVMSPVSRARLIAHHHAPQELVEVIEHGAPDRPFGREAEFKVARGHADRPILTTFGLLGPGKGLETAIKALPAILAAHPGVLYRIVGATHPNLVAEQGESYRLGLQALADRLGVSNAIEWVNRYVETPELLDQLEACDVYLTPYPNLQQSTSGTLSYAVALGKAVVSTPFIHARELLADGNGVLVEPNSPEGIATAVIRLLDDKEELAAQKRRAYERGRSTIWPRFAEKIAGLVDRTVAPAVAQVPVGKPSFAAIRRMSDATGMLQHAIGVVPDRRHGYCLDDNVRALMLTNVASGLTEEERSDRCVVYASFVQHAWNAEVGKFRNFMRFDREWCEDYGSPDSNGRALWALARTAAENPDPDLRDWAVRLYDQVLDSLADLDSPRTLAFIALGNASMLRLRSDHEPSRDAAARSANIISRLLEVSRRPDWAWFEAMLAYDNPRLPQALIALGRVLDRDDYIATGLETLAWICERQSAPDGHFRPVGSESFGRDYEALPFDQQPLEAQATLDACAEAFAANSDPMWQSFGLAAWRWFFGANDRGVILADLKSGLCRDGVTPRGINLNCGAESILALHLAYQSMQALEPDRINTTGKPVDHEIYDRQPVARP